MKKREVRYREKTLTSALSDSQSSAPSLTSLFPFQISTPSEAVVPLVITMQLFHPVAAAHIMVSDRSGLLTSVSALQRQIWKLSDSHCDGNSSQSGCNPDTMLVQCRQSKEM